MKVSEAGREGTVLREAAWPLVGRLNSSRLPGPTVSTLQGEALGLSRRHWAGRAAQIGTVGSCGMPRRIRVLEGPRETAMRREGQAGLGRPQVPSSHPDPVA